MGAEERIDAAPGHGRRCAARGAGFTLVELIVVIIILGILAAMLVPKYMDFVESSRQSVAKSAVSEGIVRFKGAFNAYLATTGHKPEAVADLSGSEYLNLDGGGRVNTGAYDLTYVSTTSSLTVTAYNPGEAVALANATVPWP